MPSLYITDQVISFKDGIFVQSICRFTPLTHMAQKTVHISETVLFGAVVVVVVVFLSVLMLMIILFVGSESFQHQCSLQDLSKQREAVMGDGCKQGYKLCKSQRMNDESDTGLYI